MSRLNPNAAGVNNQPGQTPIAAEALIEKIRSSAKNAEFAALADASRDAHLATNSGTSIPGGQGNANLIPGGKDYAGLTGANKAVTVEMRANCARLCKMQGRTSCPYCLGEGFAAKSVREGNPSRNANKSRSVVPEGDDCLRRV
jgi:hypothetical protein